jgi:hypothetical protein
MVWIGSTHGENMAEANTTRSPRGRLRRGRPEEGKGSQEGYEAEEFHIWRRSQQATTATYNQ